MSMLWLADSARPAWWSWRALRTWGSRLPTWPMPLASFDCLDRRQFYVDDGAYLQLRQWALRWSRAIDRSSMEGPGRDRGRRHEPPDLGL